MTTPITIAKRTPNTAAAASPGRSVSANYVSANRSTDYESSSPKLRNSSIGVPGRSPNKWRPHNTSLGSDSGLKTRDNVGADHVTSWKTDLPTRMRKPPPKFAADNGTTTSKYSLETFSNVIGRLNLLQTLYLQRKLHPPSLHYLISGNSYSHRDRFQLQNHKFQYWLGLLSG